MVYQHEHVLIRFNGHFGTSASDMRDRWSVGLRFGLVNTAPVYDAAKLQTFVQACKAAGDSTHVVAGVGAGTSTWFDQTAGAAIGVSGKYAPSTQQTIFSSLTPVLGLGAPVQPWNTAHVISLRTANPRGRASNGRMYWPCLSLVPDTTTGRLTTAQVSGRLTAFKAMFDSLNTAANAYFPGMRLLVASAVGGGSYATVTHIRADQRLDSIERRENDLPAVYGTATLA